MAGAWAAEQVARDYLTWGPEGPESASVQPASASTDRLAWVEIAVIRTLGPATTDYVVAADTSLHGVVYLELMLDRRATGQYTLARYPAFVAPPISPSTSGDSEGVGLPTVMNVQLERVLVRGLGHFLDADRVDLAADMAAGVTVSPPPIRLTLNHIERLAVEPSGTVLATLVATDAEGTAYTLTYSVGLAFSAGRWEITSINGDSSTASGPQT